jgi:O-antigen/teichoic acid export membrane protein
VTSPPDGDHRRLSLSISGQWVASIRAAASRRWSDPLSRGGLALLINTGLTGVLGFGYWLIAARLFSTYAIGVAGALVAATTLFSGLGQLNLSGMLMRFLPTAEGKSRRLVLLTYSYVASASALLAAISLVGVRIFASPTSPLRLDTIQSIAFIFAVSATAIFTIQDSVLIGLRRAVWVPAENGAFGVAKIGILFVLAPMRSAFALFSAWMIPLTLTIPVISAVLFRRFLPQASRRRRAALLGRRAALLGREMRSKIIRFSVGDAAGGLFTQTWMYLLPVVITASLGASVNALYFTSFLFSSTIDSVAINYASPLTVEGAHTPGEIAVLIRSTLRQIFAIIFPIVVALVLLCPWLLRAFGEKYVAGVPLLRLLLIACLPKAISTVYYAYCRVERTTYKSALMQACVCIATLSAVVLVAHSYGLIGIGIAIVAVQTSAGVASSWALRRSLHVAERRHRQGRHRRPTSGHGRPEIAIRLPAPGK